MPSDPRDYSVELSGAPAVPGSGVPAPAAGRPFLSVHFACCGVYQRIYRAANSDEYRGRCPKCTKAVRFVVGDGGTSSRTFVVT